MSLSLSGKTFQNGDSIPVRYTCEGEDASPPLAWADPPKGTHSYALIVDDPDALNDILIHWLVYNIPADFSELTEGISRDQTPQNGLSQGKNSFGGIGYKGPCPPPGESHRYRFKFYALDQPLELKPGNSKTQLLAAMEGHILAQDELTCSFTK
jgi:Raf kinase inhibitor-like YbhB/YbcL family protein